MGALDHAKDLARACPLPGTVNGTVMLARMLDLLAAGSQAAPRPRRDHHARAVPALTAGGRTRAMVDRYGADMADQRAIEAKRRMGDVY